MLFLDHSLDKNETFDSLYTSQWYKHQSVEYGVWVKATFGRTTYNIFTLPQVGSKMTSNKIKTF